ncbi:hypothetical protein ACIOJE_04790 [Kitasatospora sp. NPDC087861]|uniref:hypothetical protein n=1 Tax=Kitasatospora sp. NPDC087861 TaxID=3364070 RepID=UPI00381BC8A4
MSTRTRAAVALLALLAPAAGCSSPPPTAPPAAPSSAPPSSSPGPAVLRLDEHADGTTVRVAPGTVVRIELPGTYWSAPAADAPQTLRPTGGTTSPAPSCRPGAGCGEVTAGFLAGPPGTAHVSAHRTTCGEALVCPPGQRTFTVTVTVAAGA